jgi:hypothetical protein
MEHLLRSSIAASVVSMLAVCYPFCSVAAGTDSGSDVLPQMFVFNAFGTLGVVHSSDSQADFVSSISQADGAGYSRSWSAEVDSRVGAQVTAHITSQLSAVLQLVSEQNYADSFRPEVEWANIRYQLTPEFDVRIGRIVVPLFLVSETRKVGYSNPWVRPPVEFYNIDPLTSNDGIDLSYRLHLGEVTSTLTAAYGRSYRVDFPVGDSVEVRDFRGLFDRTEYGSALFNLSYLAAHVTQDPAIALFQDFREFGAAGNAIADRFEFTKKLVTVFSIGASYDPGSWFATGEWATFDSRSFSGTRTAWYLSSGIRVARVTPFMTYSAERSYPTSSAGLNASTLPANLAGVATALDAGLNQVLRTVPLQTTESLGARWDFFRNLDLKLQIDHMRLGAGSYGTLQNVEPGFRYGGTVNLFSAAIDFVY